MSVAAALEHLVGMQAQAPDLPYVGLWSRLEGFQPDRLSRLIAARRAVHLSLLRNTIHVVTARDAMRLKPVFEPFAQRAFYHGSPWGRNLSPAATRSAIEFGRDAMHEKPRTVAEMARLLAQRFPDHDGLALAYAVRSQVPLVFTPPRGIWHARGAVMLTTFEAWLGREPGPAQEADELVMRYLAAFGPASPADMRAWSGLALRGVFERLRRRLVTFTSESGTELFDLPNAPRPNPEIEAPVRFLPDYDNILLGHADRTRILPQGRHVGLFSSNGIMKGAIVVDGFVRGAWKPAGGTLAVTPFEKPLTAAERATVEREGMSLLELLAPGEKHAVAFAPVKP